MNCLMIATKNNNLDVVKALINQGGSNLYTQCNKLNNCLHYAIETHNKDLIKFILDCDAENNYLRKETNARG